MPALGKGKEMSNKSKKVNKTVTFVLEAHVTTDGLDSPQYAVLTVNNLHISKLQRVMKFLEKEGIDSATLSSVIDGGFADHDCGIDLVVGVTCWTEIRDDHYAYQSEEFSFKWLLESFNSSEDGEVIGDGDLVESYQADNPYK
jgi:hypothetical protein